MLSRYGRMENNGKGSIFPTDSQSSGYGYAFSLVGRRSLAGVEVNTCPSGQAPFIEQAALHQTHTIIFYIAMTHITLGVCVMATAQKRVEKYAEWEHYGDKETDDPGILMPPHRKGCFMTTLCSCKEQFTQSVTASSFVAIHDFMYREM